MTVSTEDRLALIRMPGLITRHRAVLSDFEAELIDEIVERYRDRGDRISLTVNEGLVLADAYRAMNDAARTAA